MRDTKHEILQFWFEECEPPQWFIINQSFDDEISERFLTSYEMACEGLNDHWAEDAGGALALCLLLDQFPRHMFRGTARMVATDNKALAIAKQAIARGFDQVLPHEQRFFVYLPFEHSEELADQKKNLNLFEAMAVENPVAYHVAQQRFDVFEKFGRFPDRNAILGRKNTEDEETYLAAAGSNIKI